MNKQTGITINLDNLIWFLKSMITNKQTLTSGQRDYILKRCQTILDLVSKLSVK